MLLGRRSGDLNPMPWKVRGSLVSWTNSSVGIQSCPTPPRRPAVRPGPKPACGMFGLWTRKISKRIQYVQIPGHALHEKGVQRQQSVGPLVSSQEQRALLVPLINRGLTAYQPLTNRLSTAYKPLVNRLFCSRISLVRASGETFRRRFFDALESTRDSCFLREQFC